MTHRVILDCDNTMGISYREVDDGLTLLYLLGCPDIEVVGITTTFGNGTIDEVHPVTEALLEDVGREDIPLYRGAGEADQAPTPAAHFLAETVAAHPGEISVLAIGPVGNLRGAAQVNADFFKQVKEIALMGGYLRPLRVGKREVDELNLASDPRAAFDVLHAPCPVTVMNAHTCLQAPFQEEHLSKLSHWRAETLQILRQWLEAMEAACGLSVFYLWDLLPAVYFSHPELFDENPVCITSTVEDLQTGTLVIGEQGEGSRVNMPSTIVDRERFMQVLFQAWDQVEV